MSNVISERVLDYLETLREAIDLPVEQSQLLVLCAASTILLQMRSSSIAEGIAGRPNVLFFAVDD